MATTTKTATKKKIAKTKPQKGTVKRKVTEFLFGPGKGGADSQESILPPLVRRKLTFRIVGLTLLCHHAWSDKGGKQGMRDKHQGKRTTNREVRNPEQEVINAAYWFDEEQTIPALPLMSVKNAVISVAHKDLGIPKTLVQKALHLYSDDYDVEGQPVVAIETADGKGKIQQLAREDVVRVNNGKADLRYRPFYQDWGATLCFELVTDDLSEDDVLRLVERAGLTVGIGEHRPEKGGEWGRFQLDRDFDVISEPWKE